MSHTSYTSERVLLGLSARLDGAAMPFAEPGTEPNYAPSRAARIQHIELWLTFSLEHRAFTGRARIQWAALPGFSGRLELDLDEVELVGVQDLGEDGEIRPIAAELADGKLVVSVPGKTGGALEVSWCGRDPRRGLYFTGPEPWAPDRPRMAWTQCQDEDAHFVVPCFDQPGVRHPWRIHLRGPAGTTLLSNGAEVEQGEDADGAFATFEQALPMPAYLLTAVCAPLVAVSATWRGRSVRYLVPPGEDEAIERAFAKTPLMMEHLSQRYGFDYPWPRYDQVVVHDFIFGGMENTACTTMTDLLLVDPASSLEWDPDRLVVHELAHQWFGDLVTCQDWSQGWLNESWATFTEALWWEYDRSPEEAIWYKYGHMQAYLGEDGGRYRRPIVSYHFREPIDVFDHHLYEKGACVLNTLRAELGAEAFWAGVRTYLERHAHQAVHSRHFQRALEDATGRNLDRFFAQWIDGAGHPVLEVKLSEEGGFVNVAVKQTQSGVATPEVFFVGLTVEVVFDAGDGRRYTLPIRERERTFVLPVEGKVVAVRVDPGFNLLAEVTLKAPRPWLTRLSLDPDPVLALRASKALLDDGGVEAFAAFLHVLGAHPQVGLRAELCDVLGRRGGPEARDALIDRFEHDVHPVVRRAAAEALGLFRETRVADVLLAAAAQPDPVTPHLRRAVLMSLGKTRDLRALDVLRAHVGPETWADQVAQGALMGLACTEDSSVLPDLLAATATDRRPRVRSAAGVALGILADKVEAARPRAVERLIEMLGEEGFRPQLAAMDGLSRIRDGAALGPLAQLHRGAPDGRTRRMAYEAMYKIRQGRTSEAGLAQLRARLDQLANENHALRGRIEKLERPEG